MKAKSNMGKRFLGLILLLFLGVTGITAAMAEEPSRVVILPFKMHADRDLSFLKEGIVDMLTSRLSSKDSVLIVGREDTDQVLKDISGTVNEKIARSIGSTLEADYVLFGSLTVFGSSISLDGKMADVHEKRPTLSFFKQAKHMDEVIPQVNLLAAEINQKVFGREAQQTPARAQAQPDIYAHPEKLLSQGPADQGEVRTETPLVGMAPGPVATIDWESAGFWKSRNFEVFIKGISLGDVDGDGNTETVFIDNRHIYVYRFENKRFLKIGEMTAKRSQRLMGVDVADINGNGRAEIFVTSLKSGGRVLDSFVMEWAGDDFARVSEHEAWYYRVIDSPEGGKLLAGQKRKMHKPFVPGIYRLDWHNGEYAQQERLTSLTKINVFGFALGNVMNTSEPVIVAFDESDYVRVFTSSGEEQWKSPERYGGSTNYLESDSPTRGGSADGLFLPQRIFIKDLDSNGKHEVIVVSNQGDLGRLFARYRKFSSAHLTCLSWEGPGLTPLWQTKEISGYISDYALGDFDQDGKDEILVAVVAARGTAITSARSSIIGFEVPQPAPTH